MGLALIYDMYTLPLRDKILLQWKINKDSKMMSFISIIFVFVTLSFTGIFFRSADMAQVKDIFSGIFIPDAHLLDFDWFMPNAYSFIIVIITLFSVWILKYINGNRRLADVFIEVISRKHFIIRWSAYAILLYIILNFSVFTRHEFIYFQF